ncbi:hypothetical protein [Bacillus methanolicus]|uniref:Putative membrane protein n=1 Tax=Bacillus methanolicus (strain MGA3 / ATCC 53907) TaxID=796606 RepID=I3DU41_BACMM|nr:hypothetical protein [Bacillus methanolicus]AIE59861.1 putative membrane protein [Bacillus methanolicus MGA3]EIJ77762.1 hypothetical protein MGA3_16643 [Bacillus methanolicus MGA3]
MPFVERLEYIGIFKLSLDYSSEYLFSDLDFKQVNKTNNQSQTTACFIAILCLIISVTFQAREEIKLLDEYISKAGFWFTYVYIPLLFTSVLIAKKVKGK